MGLYQNVKAVVPLEWKERFHEMKSLSRDVGVRVENRLRRRPSVPDPDLIYLVAAHRSAKQFVNGGRTASLAIRETLRRNGVQMDQLGAILDFGCGSGRIMRHWSGLRGPSLHGTDYNEKLVEWCKNNLKFANFEVNKLSGELPYASETFDFIYAFSVFTHLTEPLQHYWITELSRVLRPGGYLYLTTHGEYYLRELNASEQDQFRKGQLVVREIEQSGSNDCAAFHPPSYVREQMRQNLVVVDFIASGAQGDSMHDIHLLQKPAS